MENKIHITENVQIALITAIAFIIIVVIVVNSKYDIDLKLNLNNGELNIKKTIKDDFFVPP